MKTRLLAGAALLLVAVHTPQPSTASEHNPLKPMSLEHVLVATYQNNPALKAAREELKKTQELYPQARSGWLPTVGAETSMYATDVDSSNFGNGDGATTKDFSLNVDQPIWRGGRTFAEADRAKDLIRAGHAILQQEEQDIFLDAVTAHLNVISDRALLDLRRKNENILDQEFNAVLERFEIGDITDTDVQQAKTRLSRARSERIQAEANLEISMAEFEEVVGVTAPTSLTYPEPSFEFPDNPNTLLALAEKQNPEIRAALFRHEAAQHSADASFRELFPQVSAFASVNKQFDPQPGIVEDSATETIGIRATLTLFEGGATRSRIREAQKDQKKREYEIQEIKQRVKQETMSNWRSYVSARLQEQNRQDEIQSAEAALKGVKVESSEGQRTVLDVLDADQEVINAKSAHINAKRNEILSQYALANSLGLLNMQKMTKE